MSVYLSGGAVCEEDARMVGLMGFYVQSPAQVCCASPWQQDGPQHC